MSNIDRALEATLNNTDPKKGLSTSDKIEKARRMSLGESPESVSRLGAPSSQYNVRPDKYDFQLRTHGNNDELRANRFGAIRSIGTGLGKLISNTAFDLAAGLSNVTLGIPSAIANGDANMIFDNAISQSLNDSQEWMNEEVLPIYNSVKDSDKNILQRALTDLEFWTDDILGEGVPFMLSAWLTAYAGVSALRPLTKARYLNKLNKAQGLGAKATEGVAKSLQSQEQLAAAFLARTTEGLVEAKDTRDMVYEKLIAKGLSPEEATAESAKAAMSTFGLNYLLMPVEYIQAGTWFKPFSKSRDALLKATKQGIELPKRYALNKLGKDAGVNILTEGPIEENFQKAIQDYMYERFTGNDRDEFRPWQEELETGASELISRMGDNFTTKEGWDAIGTGSILGGLFGGAATALSANSKAEKERLNNAKANLDIFSKDKEKVNQRVQSIVDSLKGYDTLDKLSKVQEARNKENFWNITESLKFGEYAFANFEAGMGARLQEQVDEIANISENEFLSGYKDRNKVPQLKEKADQYEKLYNMITDRFMLPDTQEGRKIKQSLFREAILQQELEKEIGSMQNQVQELQDATKPTDEYGRIIQDKNSLVRENSSLKQTIRDIEASTDEDWKKSFGTKLVKKLTKDVDYNSKLIKQLNEAKLAFVEANGGENFIKPRTKQSKIAKDQLKVAEDNLRELTNALNVSQYRYDLLASPSTQATAGSLIEKATKQNADKKDTLQKAEQQAATVVKAQEVSQETSKPVEKVLSNKAQLGDQVSATLKADKSSIKGVVFEVNDDGTMRTVQSNGVIHKAEALESIVVSKKKADESVIENLGGEESDAFFDSLMGGFENAKPFDPFAGKETLVTPVVKPTVSPQDTTPEETEVENPDQELNDHPYLKKKRVEPYALGGLDIEYTKSGDEFIDQYDGNGNLRRGGQEEFYNHVNDPNVDVRGSWEIALVDKSGNPDSMHISVSEPITRVSTSINTTEWVRNNIPNITEEQVKQYSKWRHDVVAKLQSWNGPGPVFIDVTGKGPGALLRNQKIGTKRARTKIDSLTAQGRDQLPIGVTIKSKKGEQHVTRLYDWKGAITPPVKEFFDFGRAGGIYVGLPAANGELTAVPVWARNLSESEARLVINAVRKRFEGKNYETIPGSTWTYNDLIRYYIYPSSTVKAYDVFISDSEQIIRVGSSRYGSADLLSYPQDLIAGLMGKLHQVQNKRVINNEEVPIFELSNDQIVVTGTQRYRDYLIDSVLETDIQPIGINDKTDIYFGQPTITFDPTSVFKETPKPAEEAQSINEEEAIKAAMRAFGIDEDDPFNLPATKPLGNTFKTYLPHSKEAEINSYNEREMLEVMKLLPQVPIQVVKDIIRIQKNYPAVFEGGIEVIPSLLTNKLAVGTFHKGLITIFENAPTGTVYHEAFHAVFRMMLTEEERKDILNEYRKRGKVSGIDNPTDAFLEEMMAENFEAFMLYEGKILPDYIVERNFFQRLWDMIRTFVLNMFGKLTPEDIFKRIKTGYYTNFVPNPNRFTDPALKEYGLSPKEDVAVMNYMSRQFFGAVFKTENFDVTDVESIGLQNKQVVEIYNKIKDDFQKIADSTTGNLKAKYEHIIANYEEVVKGHQDWLAKYKIAAPDLETNPEDEALKLKDTFNAREATEFSAKDNANFIVKLFISALPKLKVENGQVVNSINEMGLPEVTDYSETWNFLLEKMNGSLQLEDMAKRLEPYFDIKPEIRIVHNLITKSGSPMQEIFKTQFRQAFSKFNTQPVTTIFEWGEGENSDKIYATTVGSDQQNLKELIKSQWMGNFINSDLVEIDPLSRSDEYLSKNSLIEGLANSALDEIKKSKNDIGTIRKHLDRFGFKFTDNAIESWIRVTENGTNLFTTSAKYIVSRLSDPNLKDKFSLFTGFEEVGNLNRMAEIEAQFNPGILEATHLNPENKPTYHYIQHNLLSILLSDINAGDLTYITKVLNSYSGANSQWAAALKAGVKPTIKLLEGSRLEGFRGKLTTKLTPGMWISTRINNVLQDKPIFSILRPAEKKSEYGIQGFELVKSGVVRNNNGQGLTALDINSQSLINQFYGYFEDEYKRTIYANLKERKRTNADIPVSLLQYLGLNSEDEISTDSIEPFDTRAKKMTFFGPIIKSKNPTLFHSLENYHRPEKDEIENIRLAIKSYVVDQINRTFDYLNDQSVIQVVDKEGHKTSRTNAYQEIKKTGNSDNIENVTIGKKQLDKYAQDTFAAIADFAVNEMVSTFEFIKLTMGDVAYYKDFFKRTPLVTGTGKTARIDSDIAKELQSEYGKLRNKYPLTKSREEIINADLNLAVVKSPKRNSSQLEAFEKQLKSLGLKDTQVANILAGYKGYDEADAFSWITPQAAREFLIRVGDWNPSLESIYQNVMEGKKVTYRKLKRFLTAMKLMGAGPIDTSDNHVLPIAYLKTATLPILPNMFKDKRTGLDDLLERMYQSGTDMVIVDSGSKGASYNIQALYSKDGSIDATPLSNAKFNFKYVKLQIDVQQQSKNRVMFGTQLRKLIWSNIFRFNNEGELIEKDYKVGGKTYQTSKLWSKFNNEYNRLTSKYKSKLLKELGINYDFENDTYQIVDWKTVVDKLKDEAANRQYPKSVIDSIKLNQDGNGLDIPGDALVNRRSIENMLNAMVHATIVTQKVPGLSAVQIPVTGFEPSKSTKTVADSTGELKFISYENGQVMSAEVYLPHNFRSKAGYLNDLDISQVDDEVLEMIGFRIPTEGLRSIIKIRVKGFLPREMGDVVVVPSELVAQAGSDFDIDKLNIMQRHYIYNEETKRIEKIKSDEDSIQGLENSVLDIVDGLLSHKDSFIPSLRTTGETVDYLKSVASDIRRLKGAPIGVEEDPLSIIEFDKKMDIAYKFIAGKDGVGVAALHNTHHVLTQAANLQLTQEATDILNMPYNKNKEGRALLSGITDTTKKHDVTDILAASVNGFVDIVKDPFIMDLFTDLNTASMALTLIRLGTPVEWVVKFVNQPLIQRYIKNTEFARSELGKITKTSVRDVRTRLREQYYNRLTENGKKLVDTATWTLTAPIYKNTSIQQLDKYMTIAYNDGQINDSVSDIANNNQFITPDEYYLSQISFLTDFLNYLSLSDKTRLLIANSASDTFRAKTFNDVDRFVRRKEQKDVDPSDRLEPIFENYQDLFTTASGHPTFIESFYNNGLKTQHDGFKEIFPIRQSNQVQSAVRRVEALVGKTNGLRDFEIERLSDSLMGYIFYKSIPKQEMSNFVLDKYLVPESRLLVSNKMRHNLTRGATNKFIKKGFYYQKGQKLNLNGMYSVEITDAKKFTPKEIIKKFGPEADIFGAKYFKANQEVVLYQVKLVKNQLVKESDIRRLHKIKTTPASNGTWKELQDNVFFNNLRVFFSKKANGVNALRFRVRPTDNVVHEDLVEHWRRMFNSGDPVVREWAWKIAKYAIYQSGMKQSNISFFKYIPPEFFSQIVNSSLTNFDENLDDPSVLNVIFRNLWNSYGDVYVPKINYNSQVVQINDLESDELIGYRLRRNIAANEVFFAISPPPFLKIRNSHGGWNLMELVGFSGERQSGDAIYQIASKLGDGFNLTEYHPGASIYEDNNEYIENPEQIYQYVNSSVSYWTASTPLKSPRLVAPVDTKPLETTNTETTSDEPQIEDTSDKDVNSMGDDWVDNMFGGEEFNPFAQLSKGSKLPANKSLDSLLRSKLAEIGVGVIDVDRIVTKFGSPIAVAKVLEGIIEIAKGKADITTLPEEAAHIFVSMLDPNSPLMAKMMKEITDYNVYKDVLKEYGEAYNGDQTKLKLEAIGKLIGNIIVNDFASETAANVERAKNWWNRLWEVLKKILQRVGLGDLSVYTSNNPTAFEEFARGIVTKKSDKTLSEAIIQNNFENIVFQLVGKKYLTRECR